MEWVNKQAVIEEIAKYLNEVDKDNGTALNGAKAMLIVKKAEAKKGFWVQDHPHSNTYRCINCSMIADKDLLGKYNYCPGCGAMMER